MIERTRSGKDIDYNQFEEYSKEYAKAKGVKRSDVNMTLTGAMLSSVNFQEQRKNLVEINIADGEEALKSYNHNIGDTVPRRTFFGLNKEEAEEIAKTVTRGRKTVGELLDELGGLRGILLDGEN